MAGTLRVGSPLLRYVTKVLVAYAAGGLLEALNADTRPTRASAIG
jgi:hypothetical protein